MHYVRTGERVRERIEDFLVKASWFRSPDVPAHLPDNVFVQMAH
ncbi:hypothetical protein BCEN4_1640008 [Burkholderia cenocepacia]|nr:hypothetical protein BCEN4_1640008 [Burkholderia cenocepacia]